MGGPEVKYPPGVYSVPEEMPPHLAERCLRSGRGQLVQEPAHVKAPAPENKMRGRAPMNKSV